LISLYANTYPKVATPIAVVGSAVVFLLTVAALGNMAFSGLKIPVPLRHAAVIVHLSTVLLALPLGISQLVLPKGTIRHRAMGYLWCALMTVTALVSFTVHTINPGGFDPIHIFSVVTLICVPMIIYFGRTGRVAQHQRTVLGLMVGALVIAGLFTFLPGRALGRLMLKLFHLR
jgi:uncharacterized membrane protein